MTADALLLITYVLLAIGPVVPLFSSGSGVAEHYAFIYRGAEGKAAKTGGAFETTEARQR